MKGEERFVCHFYRASNTPCKVRPGSSEAAWRCRGCEATTTGVHRGWLWVTRQAGKPGLGVSSRLVCRSKEALTRAGRAR